MDIHAVQPGETLYSIAQDYGVPMARLLDDNQLPNPTRLVVGQTLVIQYPLRTYTVRTGDTLLSIAQANGMTTRRLLRNNPVLRGETDIQAGQELVLSYRQEKEGALSVNGYAYPYVDRGLLQRTLPYLTNLTPFTYGFTPQGTLVPLDDGPMLAAARQLEVAPLLHLSTLTEDGGFSNELAHAILTNQTAQNTLISNLLQILSDKGYRGLDVDFEYVYAQDADAYARFIARLREALAPRGLPVLVALAPKVFAGQPGLLYEGHNYRLLSQAADQVLLMTYEWGYTYGPPMAVAPIRNVRQVVEYALTEMSPEKIWLGIPNYGYDWILPYQRGRKATSISNQYAVTLAGRYYASIRYDEQAQSPWFRYVDERGQEHEVWFEDARSIRAKLALIPEYGLYGAGYWNLMRPFPQNWLVLNALYDIRDAG
ncbi:MAG: LysM peptidoglycan-binding domain-containing protein [Lawsonibacter sp.]|nr:LysM peptidoglycan-binding domain-containing protein [Lawsonibacter sp.]